MATSFSGGGCQSTRREPPTMDKQLVNLPLALRVECILFCNLQSWVKIIRRVANECIDIYLKLKTYNIKIYDAYCEMMLCLQYCSTRLV